MQCKPRLKNCLYSFSIDWSELTIMRHGVLSLSKAMNQDQKYIKAREKEREEDRQGEGEEKRQQSQSFFHVLQTWPQPFFVS